MVARTFWTAEMVRALPDDGKRYETVHGELLVSPSPRMLHQLVHERLMFALGAYTRAVQVGQLFSSPADISWGPDVLVQPDLFVADLAETRSGQWANVQHLLLAVEIVSPSSLRADRFTKRTLYQRAGVEKSRRRWQPAGAHGAPEIPLAALFAG